MTGRKTAAAALIAAALGTTGSAAAQERSSLRVMDRGGERIQIESTGQATFSDDDRSVVSLSPGGRLSIEAWRTGAPRRRVEWTRDDGGVRQAYVEEGRATRPDAAARAWIEQMVLEAVRETGAGAERRVARIHARGGTRGVLDEIALIRGDEAKRLYYVALLRTPGLTVDQTARLLRRAGEGIGSDAEKARVLSEAARRRGLAAAGAFFDAAETLGSDEEKARVLREVASGDVLRGEVADAFFRVANTIGSDRERAGVLTTVLRAEGLRPAAAAAALRTAAEMGSNSEIANVLCSTPAALRRDPGVREAYRAAILIMGSLEERARAERCLGESTR
jgi:hypothetical protein